MTRLAAETGASMRLPAERQEARKALSRVIFDERQRKCWSASASATIGDFSHALGHEPSPPRAVKSPARPAQLATHLAKGDMAIM